MSTSMGLTNKIYVGFLSCCLENHDKCLHGSFVIWKDRGLKLKVGKILEMFQIIGSSSELYRQPDVILLQVFFIETNGFAINTDRNKGPNTTPKMSSAMLQLIKTNQGALLEFLVRIQNVLSFKLISACFIGYHAHS